MATVASIGYLAQRALSSTRRGRVLAVFERSFYLSTEQQSLLCIGNSKLGNGPLNVLCEFATTPSFTAQLKPNADFYRHGQRLYIDDRIKLYYQNALIWSPKPIISPSPDRIQQGLQKLTPLLANYSLSSGLSSLLSQLAAKESFLHASRDDPFLCKAVAAINILIDALSYSDANLLNQATALIGLGPGLTPSGDDFIGGMLLTFRSFKQDETAQLLADWALPLAKTQTNRISYAHLCCAAEGAGLAPLHNFLIALCENRELTPSLNAIDCIGHSSGWDALTGIVCACAILCRL